MRYEQIPFRQGSAQTLLAEFARLYEDRLLKFDVAKLDNLHIPAAENVLAVHYSDEGAQGNAGALGLLCCTSDGVQIHYGNYAYGDLNLDAAIEKLPMLRALDSRHSLEPPYPFSGSLSVLEDWRYLYMGALNHLFARKEIVDRSGEFIRLVAKNVGGWAVFHGVAWLCGAKCVLVGI